MVAIPMVPAWIPPRCIYVCLFHGCTFRDSLNIIRNGIDLNQCRIWTDFGRGFYVTTVESRAHRIAISRYHKYGLRSNQPVALRFRVPRERLAELHSLAFVLGDFNAVDYWSFVQHCRQTPHGGPPRHHHYPNPVMTWNGWYDLVSGPVADDWNKRTIIPHYDQFSFHTQRAIDVLNALVGSGDRNQFQVMNIPYAP